MYQNAPQRAAFYRAAGHEGGDRADRCRRSLCAELEEHQIARYIVLNDEQKAYLTDECMMDFAFNQKSARSAPMLIVVTMLTGRSGFERDGSFSTEKGTHWQSFDAGIAVQTFCLAAHALGLGTVVMGIFDDHKTAALLDIPEGQEVAAVLAIGHPAEEPMCPKRKSVDDLVSFR